LTNDNWKMAITSGRGSIDLVHDFHLSLVTRHFSLITYHPSRFHELQANDSVRRH
jgi:hypothetical protein